MAGSRATIPKKNIGTVSYPAKPVVYIMDRPGAMQSLILAGEIAPPKNNPDDIAIETMNNILGGNFGARINMNLREDKHWSYGAQSFFWSARGQEPFIVFAPVQTDKTKESWSEINKEVRGIVGDKPPTPAELAKVQANETLSLPGSRETINAVGNSIEQLVEYGFPDDYYDKYAGRVRALTIAGYGNGRQARGSPGQSGLGSRRRPREDRSGCAGTESGRSKVPRRGRQADLAGAGK